jgi:hypothetical protein
MARFEEWRRRWGGRQLRTLLAEHVPARVAAILCELAAFLPATRAAEVSSADRWAMADLLTGLPLTVTRTEGFDKAMVTRGGVALKEVNPRTLQSRLLPGLLLAGEVLDLDGPCGGFNLQWAFSSGRLAGLSAAAALAGGARRQELEPVAGLPPATQLGRVPGQGEH